MFIDIAMCLWAFSFANVKGQELDVEGCVDEGVNMLVLHDASADIRPLIVSMIVSRSHSMLRYGLAFPRLYLYFHKSASFATGDLRNVLADRNTGE